MEVAVEVRVTVGVLVLVGVRVGVKVGVLVGAQVGTGVTVPPRGEYQTSFNSRLLGLSYPPITHI